jgi:hypothetical protein
MVDGDHFEFDASLRELSTAFLELDRELLVLLGEVSFLDRIPTAALQIYQRNRVYRKYIHLLQVLIERCNRPVAMIVDIERHSEAVVRPRIEELTREECAAEAWLSGAVREVTPFSELHNKSTSNARPGQGWRRDQRPRRAHRRPER